MFTRLSSFYKVTYSTIVVLLTFHPLIPKLALKGWFVPMGRKRCGSAVGMMVMDDPWWLWWWG